MKRYNPKEIEPKWQAWWDENQTYRADLDTKKKKYIGMSMFNYPSGAGIHIGHAMNYTISDVMARFKRQQGYESYHPVGWDAFGLPAENYAIKSGVSPQASMATIIPSYHKQYKAMGWSNDWSKEISTHEPRYYRWTQWIFSEMYRQGLVYQDARMQWWCTKCQTVLSNEQVIDGKCWRHDSADDVEVNKKEVKQWFFKITDYADELLEATDDLDWTETVKTAQKNWIGKSKGAEIDFAIAKSADSGQPTVDSEDKITVFTTRPDTIFGATFLVVAPEHELVEKITTAEQKEAVAAYVKESTKKTEVERQASKVKTGVFTGSYVLNPASNEKIPVWVADYVLVGYGTGAIMAVPAHDERDNEFAKKFDLPIIDVVVPQFGEMLPDPEWVDGTSNIVYDISTDTFIGLRWSDGALGLVAGGKNDNESYEECARREIAEETGITEIEALIPLGSQVYSHYWHPVKKGNRFAKTQGYVAVVASQKSGEAHQEAHEKFTVEWMSGDELLNGISARDQVGHWVEICKRGIAVAEAHKKGETVTYPMFTEEGRLINSGLYDGIESSDAREKIVADLSAKGVATEKTIFKIRDWSVSRQRYWGAPIPIVNCPACGPVLLPDDQLPVVLPELVDFAPSGDGRSALARATEWLKADCPQCGGQAERETDTLDTYICSSWYMLRYSDPENDTAPFSKDRVNTWLPIDFYNGGDHATAHMIYARFMTRFFHKLGMIDNPEPFKRFLFNGKVTASNGEMFSKSKGNGVDPLEIINSGYGADALRTYLMFAAPLDLWIRWDAQGVPGTYRFLNRVWNLVQEYLEQLTADSRQLTEKSEDSRQQIENSNEQIANEDGAKVLRIVHPAIKKVTEDLEDQKYNTAIATMMKCTNDLYDLRSKEGFKDAASWRAALESLVMLIGPFAPHTAEELWHDLGHEESVHVGNWPMWNDTYLVTDTVNIAVQVNGKLRGVVTVASGSDEATVIAAALADQKVQTYVTSEPKKTIYVPNKLVSIVV